MYQRQTVDQHRHIVAVVVLGPLLLTHLILVDDLKAVVVDVLFIDERDVLGGAVVPPEHLHKVLLDLPGLFLDMLVGVGDGVEEKTLPLTVGKLVVVQKLQLAAQIGDEVGLLVDLQILIALLGEQVDELPLQCRLTLVTVRAVFHRLVGGDDSVFGRSCNDVKGTHTVSSHFYTFPCFPVNDP